MHVLWGALMMAMAGGMPKADEAQIVDDRVMGGVSQSRVVDEAEGFTYTGNLSRDRGGGFASMRMDARALELAGHEGLELQVRGDGRTYQFTMQRADVRMRAGSYRAFFTAPTEWTTIRLPFADFRATQMGQEVGGAPSLDGDLTAVETVGVLLSDGPEGVFRLEVRSITPYGEAREVPASSSMMETLTATIAVGVPLFNAGDAAGCRDAYRNALATFVDRPELTDGEQQQVAAALEAAEGLSAERGAWRLRYAIDTLMARR